jgi:hypothetical protein
MMQRIEIPLHDWRRPNVRSQLCRRSLCNLGWHSQNNFLVREKSGPEAMSAFARRIVTSAASIGAPPPAEFHVRLENQPHAAGPPASPRQHRRARAVGPVPDAGADGLPALPSGSTLPRLLFGEDQHDLRTAYL